MCLKKKKTEKDNALCIIRIDIALTLTILLIIPWEYKKYAFDGTTIDADITSSYRTIVSAFLMISWSGISVWIKRREKSLIVHYHILNFFKDSTKKLLLLDEKHKLY